MEFMGELIAVAALLIAGARVIVDYLAWRFPRTPAPAAARPADDETPDDALELAALLAFAVVDQKREVNAGSN